MQILDLLMNFLGFPPQDYYDKYISDFIIYYDHQ